MAFDYRKFSFKYHACAKTVYKQNQQYQSNINRHMCFIIFFIKLNVKILHRNRAIKAHVYMDAKF